MIAGQFGSTANVTLMPIKHSVLNQIERAGTIRRKLSSVGEKDGDNLKRGQAETER